MLVIFAIGIFACEPIEDRDTMPAPLSSSDVNFTVTQVPGYENKVVIENNTPGVIPFWESEAGNSNEHYDTLTFPFAGEYTVHYSAYSGGVPFRDSVKVNVSENDPLFFADPLWNFLTNGQEGKTWVLDYGKYGIFDGPLYYYEPLTDWESFQNGTAVLGWAPAWTGNEWIIPAADTASTMTFTLDGGAYMYTHKVTEGVDETGTFSFDPKAHTITTNGATILRSASFIPNATNWTNKLVVLSLTENQLQIGVRRTNEEGDYLFVWNYVSKEYADSQGPIVEEPDPNFEHGNQMDILADADSKTWKLDTEVPYNWTGLDGTLKNPWNSRADIIATGWAPYGDADVEKIDNASIEFSADGTVVVTQDDGSSAEGSFIVDEATNMISFSEITPSIYIAGDFSATTTEENQWKIVIVERNESDELTGIWFGKRDPAKEEYMVFHFVPQI